VGLSIPVSNTYVISDALSLIAARHTMKLGGEIRQQHHFFLNPSPVSLTFSRNETALPTALSTTGLEYASFLLGLVDSSSMNLEGGKTPHNLWSQAALYAQDDYKVTPTVTLNLGLRWDLYTPLTETHNWYSVMDPTAPNQVAGNLPGAYVFAGQNGQGSRLTYARNDSSNFSPRLGVAWRLNPKFVIRSAYGLSYFLTGAYGAGNNTSVLSGYWFTSTAQSLDSGITPGLTFASGFPASALVVPPYLNPALGVGSGTIQYWDSSAGRAAYMQNWNFTTQTQFSENISLEVASVGSKGTRLPASDTDINMLNPLYYSLGSVLNSSITSPAVAALGFKAPYPGFNGSIAQALRPFPQFVTSLTRALSSATIGNSTYHSLQVKLQKRLSRGVYALATYAWGKNLTDADNNFVSNGVPGRNHYDRRLDKIEMPYYRDQRITAAFTYELPFGSGKRILNRGGGAGKFVGGWQLTGLVSYMSGIPITISAAQSLPLNSGPQTPNSILGVDPMLSWSGRFDPAKNRYLNINAFTAPAPYTFGTAAYYLPYAKTPHAYNEDLSLVKNTQISERLNLQIRLEAFNILNRVVFAAPAANVSTPQTFGTVTGVNNSPRNGQIAMKLTF
jgi:hypothetical protein